MDSRRLRHKQKYRYPTDHFRRSFIATDVKKARIYASACGIYTLYINGKRVGDQVLAPGNTDYRKRIQYQTYDLKESEVVDARRKPSYSGKARAVKFNAVLSASDNFPVKRHERFTPVLITTPSGKTVLDFGKNISGSVGFRLSAKNVQKLFLASGPGRYIPVSAGPENTL